MRRADHHIRTLTFEIHTAQKKKVTLVQDQVSQLSKLKIPELLTVELDKFITKEDTLTIDLLELDLGRIRENYFEQDLLKNLAIVLNQKLRKLLKVSTQQLSRNGSRKSGNAWTMIRYFLEFGYLPWWAKNSEIDINQAFLDVIQYHGEDLKVFLKKQVHKKSLSQRISQQFSISAIKQLVQLLEPLEAIFIIDYVADIQLIQQKKQVIQSEQRSLVRSVWRFVLLFLLEERGSYFNRKHFLKSQLQQLANQYNTSFSDLLGILVTAVHTLKQRITFNSALPNLIIQLQSEEKSQLARNIGVQNFALKGIGQWLNNGQNELFTTNSVDAEWSLMMQQFPQDLRLLLKEKGKKATARSRMAHQLKIPTIHAIICILVPQNSDYIIEFVDHNIQIHKEKQFVPTGNTAFEKDLWEFTLAYLLVERGSFFNQKTYVKSVLQKIAARWNIEFDHLLEVLTQALTEVNINSGHISALKLTLSAIQQDLSTGLSTQKSVITERSAIIKWLDNEEQLPVVKADWLTFIKAAPKVFYQLIFQYGQKEKIRDRLATKLPESLIKAIIRHIEPTQADFLFHFVDQIDNSQQESTFLSINNKDLKSLLWKFSFHYLLVDRGTRFNKKAYLENQLLRLSKHYNQEYSVLLSGFYRTLLQAVNLQPYQKELVLLLKEIFQTNRQQNKNWRIEAAYLPSSGGDAIRSFSSDLEIVRYALEYHSLDYANMHLSQSSFEKIWLQSIVTTPGKFKQLLLSKEISADRLTKLIQFLPKKLVVQSVRPFSFISEVQIVELLNQFSQLVNHFAPTNISNTKSEQLFWISYFQYLSSFKNQLYKKDTFYQFLVLKIQSYFKIKSTLFLKEIQQLLKEDTLTNIKVNRLALSSLSNMKKLPSSEVIPTVTGDGLKSSANQSAKNLIFFFLTKGYLPWWAKSMNKFALSSSLQWLIDNAFSELLILLKKTGSPRLIAQRLSQNFSTSVLRKLMIAAYPEKEQELESLQHYLPIAFSKHPQLTQIIQVLSEIQLTYLLSNNQSDDWLKKVLNKIAALLAIDPSIFLERIKITTIPQQQKEIAENGPAIPKKQPDKSIETALNALSKIQLFELWEYYLLYQKIPDTSFILSQLELKVIIDLLQNQHLNFFKQSVIQSLQSTESIGKLLRHFPKKNWLQWLRWLDSNLPFHDLTLFKKKFQKDFPAHYQQFQFANDEAIILAYFKIKRKDIPIPPEKKPSEPIIWKKDKKDNHEPIFINNAGLVLLHPYYSPYLQRLGLLKDDKFVDEKAREKAVHYLQFLVSGLTHTPEYDLAFNKLLCGIKLNDPIIEGVEMNAEEKQLAEGLLNAVIQNWSILGETSISSLRNTFLIREGRLIEKEESWELVVDKKTVDILVEQLPWGLSMIQLPWLEKLITITWTN